MPENVPIAALPDGITACGEPMLGALQYVCAIMAKDGELSIRCRMKVLAARSSYRRGLHFAVS